MENLRSLEPEAKISHSYKKKKCNLTVMKGVMLKRPTNTGHLKDSSLLPVKFLHCFAWGLAVLYCNVGICMKVDQAESILITAGIIQNF